MRRPLVQISTGGYAYALNGLKVSLGDGYLAPERVKPAELMGSYAWDAPVASDGDIFVVHKPTGLNWVEATIGCPVVIGGESTWTEPPHKSWAELRDL